MLWFSGYKLVVLYNVYFEPVHLLIGSFKPSNKVEWLSLIFSNMCTSMGRGGVDRELGIGVIDAEATFISIQWKAQTTIDSERKRLSFIECLRFRFSASFTDFYSSVNPTIKTTLNTTQWWETSKSICIDWITIWLYDQLFTVTGLRPNFHE